MSRLHWLVGGAARSELVGVGVLLLEAVVVVLVVLLLGEGDGVVVSSVGPQAARVMTHAALAARAAADRKACGVGPLLRKVRGNDVMSIA